MYLNKPTYILKINYCTELCRLWKDIHWYNICITHSKLLYLYLYIYVPHHVLLSLLVIVEVLLLPKVKAFWFVVVRVSLCEAEKVFLPVVVKVFESAQVVYFLLCDLQAFSMMVSALVLQLAILPSVFTQSTSEKQSINQHITFMAYRYNMK